MNLKKQSMNSRTGQFDSSNQRSTKKRVRMGESGLKNLRNIKKWTNICITEFTKVERGRKLI